ncbi:hypothetical protein SAMN05443639_12914 [Stigmatella erecta]|uniref:Uncharacterized protein n=2 Tax=Stigmatella erecta TaxID=83460 RepID=A0A1I0LH04_9BACT|nr:hypothetical protein SAMN05443639_12914 [Stigmatella erecta]
MKGSKDVRRDEAEKEAPQFHHQFKVDGVQLGGGARLGEASRFMARLGYQLAAPESFLHSLSVETDFREQLVLTPLTQYATPQLFILPSLGFGVGVPVQVLPEASWDHYPRLREGPDSQKPSNIKRLRVIRRFSAAFPSAPAQPVRAPHRGSLVSRRKGTSP